MRTEVVRPDAKRMIEGLRDTGYEFNIAVADLIDNSIAADASIIDIDIEIDYAGNITLSVADNGNGMDYKTLLNGMKYGSPPRPDPRSLGKFGLGMKTASTAFCRRLSVTTRNTDNGDVYKAVWDLDHVAEVGEWELLIEDPQRWELEILDEISNGGSGTVVSWSKVDRLLKEYSDPGGVYAQRALDRQIEELQEHLEMVYQRFLDPADEREPHKIKIKLNGGQIRSWDPFCISESDLVASDDVRVGPQDSDEVIGTFQVKAYILPRREEFPNQDNMESAKISNENQGFYIYRENRLIHGPDWLGMYSKEPHGSLLRVEFSFSAVLDETLHIDIKKSKIILNETLYRWLKDEFLGPPRRAADIRYRKGQKKKEKESARGAHHSSNIGIGSQADGIPQAGVDVINEDTGEVKVTNPRGTLTIRIPITHPVLPDEVYIHPVDSIVDGLLWTPAIIDGHQGIELNTSHEFYRKIYLPNILEDRGSNINVQGIDSLLWALGVAELNAVVEATQDHFLDLRYEVSRTLRKLMDHLPEPPEPDLDE